MLENCFLLYILRRPDQGRLLCHATLTVNAAVSMRSGYRLYHVYPSSRMHHSISDAKWFSSDAMLFNQCNPANSRSQHLYLYP